MPGVDGIAAQGSITTQMAMVQYDRPTASSPPQAEAAVAQATTQQEATPAPTGSERGSVVNITA